MGYSSTKKGYKCYYPTFKKLYVTMDVTFHEAEVFSEFGFFIQGKKASIKDILPFPIPEPCLASSNSISIAKSQEFRRLEKEISNSLD